jgi:hypothetical protein
MSDTKERPKNWEDIAKKKFFIINGQHSVGASIRMQTLGLPPKIVKPFLE